jgi:hypothetical protein
MARSQTVTRHERATITTGMTTTEYARVVVGQMQVVLRPAGFRRQVKSFTAERDETVLLVQLQGSERSTASDAALTVNLGVFSRALQAHGERGLSSIAGYTCHWWQRIGFVSPDHSDRWWRVHGPVSAVEAGAEIAALLKLYGLPALERLSSTDRLRAHWRDGGDGGVNRTMRDRFLAVLETG